MKVTQPCPTLCDPMDYTVHKILQARILEYFSLLQEIFPTQGSNPDLLHCRQILYQLSPKGSPRILEWVACPFSGDLPDPGIEPVSPALQMDSLPTELWISEFSMPLETHEPLQLGTQPTTGVRQSLNNRVLPSSNLRETMISCFLLLLFFSF